MNYFYGQAPASSSSLPFTFHPMQRGASSLGVGTGAHPGMPSVGFPSSHSQQPASVGIKPASEVYASAAWNLKPGTSVGGAHADNSHNFKGHHQDISHGPNPMYSQTGGKGRAKGGRWGGSGYQSREFPGTQVGKQANAIPLGKQRVFASSPETSEEAEPERPRARSPVHRPMQVVGRGRALTTPAWAKEVEKPPGEDRQRNGQSRYDERRSYEDQRQERPDRRNYEETTKREVRHHEDPRQEVPERRSYEENRQKVPERRYYEEQRPARHDRSPYENEKVQRPEERDRAYRRDERGDRYESSSSRRVYDRRAPRRVSRSRSAPRRRSRRE